MKAQFTKVLLLAASALLSLNALAKEEKAKPAPPRERTDAEKVVEYDAWLKKATPVLRARGDQINAIVRRFSRNIAQMTSPQDYQVQLTAKLHALSGSQLAGATTLTKLPDLESYVNRPPATEPSAATSALAMGLGDNVNLVFRPVTPCRFANSMSSSAGILTAYTARPYYIDASAVGQGGNIGCNYQTQYNFYTQQFEYVRTLRGPAAAITITVGSTQDGWASLAPYNTSTSTSVINYVANQFIANTTIVKANTTSGQPDIQVTPSTNAHVLLDLVGYYMPSQPTALEVTTTSATTAAIPGPNQWAEVAAPACPSGYTRVSLRCTGSHINLYLQDVKVGEGLCGYRNNDSVARDAYAASVCARVPGQ